MGARPARVPSARRRVLALAPLALFLGSALPVLAAGGSRPGAPPAYFTGAYGISMLGQSTSVGPGQTWSMHLAVSAPDPAATTLAVQVYEPLITRTGFDEAAAGQVGGTVEYTVGPTPLTKLSADPAGGVDIEVPVSALDVEYGSGVFPVQVGLYSTSGVLEGSPLTTFLVFAVSPTAVPLAVALMLPVQEPPSLASDGTPGALPPSESRSLAAYVGALAAGAGAQVTLDVGPELLAALAAGGSTDHNTLSVLESLISGGPYDTVSETYAPESLGALADPGLASEVSAQIAAGDSVQKADTGAVPSRSTWELQGGLDQATLLALVQAGITRLILPSSDLTALPSSDTETTFAQPTYLTQPGEPTLEVEAADTGLTSDFDAPGGPVLAANRLLAELAMIQLESPGYKRAVAVVPPAGWQPNPLFVTTLLSGLQADPLLAAKTASTLFAAAPVAAIDRSLSGAGTPALGLELSVPALSSVRQTLGEIASVFPGDAKRLSGLNDELFVAESGELTPGQASKLLGLVTSGAKHLLGQVFLTASGSITLTSTKGSIPVTVLSSGSVPAHVQLRLSSQRLIFKPAGTTAGSCVVPNPTSEVCQLVLAGDNTTLKVPVQCRASGAFPLEVGLWTPTGALLLVSDHDTVRNTTIPGVGIAIIILAVVSLAVWWVRDLRHGRRARRLMAPPGNGEGVDEDELVRSFLGSGEPRVSPSTLPAGPKGSSVAQSSTAQTSTAQTSTAQGSTAPGSTAPGSTQS